MACGHARAGRVLLPLRCTGLFERRVADPALLERKRLLSKQLDERPSLGLGEGATDQLLVERQVCVDRGIDHLLAAGGELDEDAAAIGGVGSALTNSASSIRSSRLVIPPEDSSTHRASSLADIR